MIPPYPNCRKNNFLKTRDRDKHLNSNRARLYLPRNLPVLIQNIIPASTSIQNTPLSENPTPIGDLISFDKNIPTYYPNMSNVPVVDFLTNLNIEVPWLVSFPDNKEHHDVWQNSIQYAKDIFKVDGAEYAFSTWFRKIKKLNFEARMTEERAQRILNTIDNYEYLIRVKFIRDNTVISVEKTKKALKLLPNIRIDKKFLIREVSEQSEVGKLDSNAVVYELYRIRKPGHGLTEIHRQKINDWEKKIRIPAKNIDQTILGKLFNNALQDPQEIWLMGVGDENQRVSQFVLEDGCAFRTWIKHTDIIKACKKLFEDASLKVVDLAKQVFGANHARSRLVNKINEWCPISEKINDIIRQACVEHRHGGRWNASNYHINDVVCIDMKSCYPAIWYRKYFACRNREGCVKSKGWAPIVLLQYLFETGILEDLTIREVIISLTQQTKVWLSENQDISCAIIGKFIQGGKIDEKHLIYQLVTDESELDFLIKDCTDAGTFAGREKCPLRFILTYYEGHQPQYTYLRASMLTYAHINLLEMLQRFDPNEV
ncbi:4130_t:CDS:2, partial [Racocetra persica]